MIGVFDSGFGGLTVLKSLMARLPSHDFLYLGDSARSPYGGRSPRAIVDFTWQAVQYLFNAGCPLVVLACNTASARALRTIQQRRLPESYPDNRVLGVVRPSAEVLAGLPPGAQPGVTPPTAASGDVAVLATQGTVVSNSYGLELAKLAPNLRLHQKACPMWVPLVENGETEGPGVDHFIQKYLSPLFDGDAAPRPQRLLLGCTHYPMLSPSIRRFLPDSTMVVNQAEVVSERLVDWLSRHPEMDGRLSKNAHRTFVTTDDPEWFAARGAQMLSQPLTCARVDIVQ